MISGPPRSPGENAGEKFRWNAVNPKGYPVGPDRLEFILHLVDYVRSDSRKDSYVTDRPRGLCHCGIGRKSAVESAFLDE